VQSHLGLAVDYVEVYHCYVPYGSLETKVIEPIADGVAGLAYGTVWAAIYSI
jgi:hypothetical protein